MKKEKKITNHQFDAANKHYLKGEKGENRESESASAE
jgi:hypothetical protein